jgi:hypothetical protein
MLASRKTSGRPLTAEDELSSSRLGARRRDLVGRAPHSLELDDPLVAVARRA